MKTPLLAFLVPFSAELWVTIFVSLNVTALAVAIYEWLSPFGLNPWGRQRTKNFSYGSALWVIWGLLFSHLVAFKAPKSWPNKVLINVWGAFSVIFVASYTANIAALFAGLFNRRDTHDRSFYSLRVGAIRWSASEFYISRKNPSLWAHIKGNLVRNFTEALDSLHSGRLEVLVGDAAILDHMRANDPGCTLQSAGSDLVDDTYAVAMPKGFPLKMKINAAISQYVASGHLEYLRHKWYGSSPCFRLTADIYKPQPLEFATVAGVFLMLILGIVVGIFILFLEHIVYRYSLPSLRNKPKGSIWRNRNLMFFSQKMYKFINCYELVSPHHSAKELVNNLRTGQIMGLFQKSVKRKENEQRRRRKSKAQFFEMIQEIRRVQKEEKSLEQISSSMEILEANTAANRSILPEGNSFTTSFTASVTSDVAPIPPPSTASLHSPSPSALLRAPPLGSTNGGRSPPGITIDYIPGPNPKEDYEGILIVNRGRSPLKGMEGERREVRKKRRRAHQAKEQLEEEDEEEDGSKSSLSNSYLESPLKRNGPVEGGGSEKGSIRGREDEWVKDEDQEMSTRTSKETRRKKRHRRRLERSSRVDSSEDVSNGVFTCPPDPIDAMHKRPRTKRGKSHNGAQAKEDGTSKTTSQSGTPQRPSAVSAPASLFGEDSSCRCKRLQGAVVTVTEPSRQFLPLPSHHCPWAPYNPCPSSGSTEPRFKSKSLDETEIQPPSGFMSPALSPIGIPAGSPREFTSISFPSSPYVIEAPSTCEGSHLRHFLSEGDERWGDWERQQRHFYSPRETPEYATSLSTGPYLSSAGYRYSSALDTQRDPSEPHQLRNITKVDLWKMWRDSEHELRQRLYQIEYERNLLASRLSSKYKAPSEKKTSYDGNVYRRGELEVNSGVTVHSGCLSVELEVPIEFRDPTSKELRRDRYSRSLDEGHPHHSSVRGPDSGSYMDYEHCDDLLGCRSAMGKEYDDFFRSARSLEDSTHKDNDLRSSEGHKRSHQHKISKAKSSRRRKDSVSSTRRCRSSLDSRRSHSLATGSHSGSSESPKTERMSASSFDTRSAASNSIRGRSRKKKAPISLMSEFSDKSSISRDYRRKKSKPYRGDKQPFLSLPRSRSQHRRKDSSTLSYCSQSSSSDQEEDLIFKRQYTDPSSLPLLQSLQRHSLGKHQRPGTSSHAQKQRANILDPRPLDTQPSRKNLRRVSPFVERVPYLVREGVCLQRGVEFLRTGREMPHEWHVSRGVPPGLTDHKIPHVSHSNRRRSSLDIPEPRSVSELY